MHAELVVMAQSTEQRRGSGEFIYHSDGRVQYCSGLNQTLYERYGSTVLDD